MTQAEQSNDPIVHCHHCHQQVKLSSCSSLEGILQPGLVWASHYLICPTCMAEESHTPIFWDLWAFQDKEPLLSYDLGADSTVPPNRTLDGFNFWYRDRRRYSNTTFTWISYSAPGKPELWDADCLRKVMPSAADLRTIIRIHQEKRQPRYEAFLAGRLASYNAQHS